MKMSRVLFVSLLLLSGCCAKKAPPEPAWKWSKPFYAPPGMNVACGAGGKACEG